MYTTSALTGRDLLCPQAGPPRRKEGLPFLRHWPPFRAQSSPVTVRYAASKKPELSPFPLLLPLSVRPSVTQSLEWESIHLRRGESRSLSPFSSSYPACCKGGTRQNIVKEKKRVIHCHCHESRHQWKIAEAIPWTDQHNQS